MARQPIFNTYRKVYGYELLHRRGDLEHFDEPDGDRASMSIIRNTLLLIGPEKIARGKKAFINFTRNLLINDTAFLLPKSITVIEILEDIEIDGQLLDACLKIKKNGYLLALDDFILKGNEKNPLPSLVDILKVDFKATESGERKAIVNRFSGTNVRLLAEKTETMEEFKEAQELGFSLFQGYFFSKPTLISTKDMPLHKISYVRILRELCEEPLNLERLKKLLEQDPTLIFRLLKYINSAFFSLRHEIHSIKHALALLGQNEIRKWASLVVITRLGEDLPGELVRLSLTRAHFCEFLAPKVGLEKRKNELFLMGILSLMDVFLGRPLEETLRDMPLSNNVKKALVDGAGTYGLVYDLAVKYEKGEWEKVSGLVRQLAVSEEEIPVIYTKAIECVDKMLGTK